MYQNTEQALAPSGVDFFVLNGSHYLLMAFYCSRFLEVLKLTCTMAVVVIAAIRGVFSRFCIPDMVLSDNGPLFAPHNFALFAMEYGFQCDTSSPHYLQGNGEAVHMVLAMR